MSRDHYTEAEQQTMALRELAEVLRDLNSETESQAGYIKQIATSAERSERQLITLAERVRMLEKHAEREQRASDMALDYLLSNSSGVFITREPNGQAVAYAVSGDYQLNAGGGFVAGWIRSAHAVPGELDRMALVALARYVQAEREDEFAGSSSVSPTA